MKRQQKRYTDRHDIVSDINALKRKATKLREEAVALDLRADEFFRHGMGDDGRLKRSEADSARKRATTIEEVKLKKLGNALAEFDSVLLPGMEGDEGVVLKAL